MISEATGSPDNNMGAPLKGSALLHRIHSADASHDAGRGRRVEPLQFVADLHGELTSWRDHKTNRLTGPGCAIAL